jgi:hypothetical protein
MATEIFAETLEKLQFFTWCILESRSYIKLQPRKTKDIKLFLNYNLIYKFFRETFYMHSPSLACVLYAPPTSFFPM